MLLFDVVAIVVIVAASASTAPPSTQHSNMETCIACVNPK